MKKCVSWKNCSSDFSLWEKKIDEVILYNFVVGTKMKATCRKNDQGNLIKSIPKIDEKAQ